MPRLFRAGHAFLYPGDTLFNPFTESQRLSLKRVNLKLLTSPVFRGAVGIAGASLFLAVAWCALLTGASRSLSDYSVRTGNLTAAETSVRMTPGDPQAHLARADLLYSDPEGETGAPGEISPLRREATRSYRDSLKLRPLDYALWDSLGQALEEIGERDEALRAFTEATRLAPFYARPRWQLGNFLVRQQGRDREAFDHLRRAASSDPVRFPNLIDLAWRFYNGEVSRVEAAVRPETDAERLRLARFYVKQAKAKDAMRLYGQLGATVAAEQKALLTDLLAAGEFAAAHQLWLLAEGAAETTPGQIYDGGFEREIRLHDPGFGWQIAAATANDPTVSIALDSGESMEGRRSLRVDFNGASAPATPIISQLVLAEAAAAPAAAGRPYRLTFAARTKDLVTGGLPIVTVTDASAPDKPVLLAQSKTLPPKEGGVAEGWQTFNVEFTPAHSTRAIRVALLRQNCAAGGGPCPAFGHVWLDAFTLKKL